MTATMNGLVFGLLDLPLFYALASAGRLGSDDMAAWTLVAFTPFVCIITGAGWYFHEKKVGTGVAIQSYLILALLFGLLRDTHTLLAVTTMCACIVGNGSMMYYLNSWIGKSRPFTLIYQSLHRLAARRCKL